ncbi:hypothetical protein [Baekduia alba]|uniref:hypothetical protein n=1 Tax=Baekduia alba TaxID=2997333 RepID=UPI0023400241|nr:hypothetical protein [Baekduia alba]
MAAVEHRRRPARTEWFWAELELCLPRQDVRDEAFVTRWRGGALTREELRAFAVEHELVVRAVAAAAYHAAGTADALLGEQLAIAALRAKADVARWLAFGRAVGAPTGEPSIVRDATAACARAVIGSAVRPLAATLVALWVVERATAAFVPPQAARLFARYGIDPGGAVWFDRHVAGGALATLEAAIEGQLDRADPFALLAGARATAQAHAEFCDALTGASSPSPAVEEAAIR